MSTKTSVAGNLAEAFNRHGAFTAKVTENGMAVAVRLCDTGQALTTVWVPRDGNGWTWPLTPNSERWRYLASSKTIPDVVRAVATSVLDEGTRRG